MTKLERKQICVLTADCQHSNLDGKSGNEFHRGEARNPNDITPIVNHLLNRWCTGFVMVELDQSASIEKMTRQVLVVPALGNDLGGHGPRYFRQTLPNFLPTWRGLFVFGFLLHSFDVFDRQSGS